MTKSYKNVIELDTSIDLVSGIEEHRSEMLKMNLFGNKGIYKANQIGEKGSRSELGHVKKVQFFCQMKILDRIFNNRC